MSRSRHWSVALILVLGLILAWLIIDRTQPTNPLRDTLTRVLAPLQYATAQGTRPTSGLLAGLSDGPEAAVAQTLAISLLNPHVYLDTVLLIGSLGAQQSVPGAYVVGAASASLMWFFTLALGAAWLAPWLARPNTWRILDLLVAVMMYAVALQLIVSG